MEKRVSNLRMRGGIGLLATGGIRERNGVRRERERDLSAHFFQILQGTHVLIHWLPELDVIVYTTSSYH